MTSSKRRLETALLTMLCLCVAGYDCALASPGRPWDLPNPPKAPSSPRDFPLRAITSSLPGDELWQEGFGLPSADGVLNCAIKYGSDLIVGGSFRRIGGIAANNIARWDGTAWHPLGDGLERTVTCLAIYRGDLFAGGQFQYVNGQLSPHLARWDGASWFPVGAFTGSYTCCYEMNQLAVYGDELIAAGDFGSDQLPAISGIRRWDGSAWQSLGSGVDGPVDRVLVVGDTLYAAGEFGMAGEGPANHIASWDGRRWHALGTGISDPAYWRVRALASYRGLVFVGGDFDSAGSVPVHGLASWDGANWSAAGDFDSGSVTSMTEHHGVLEVLSVPEIQQWDGSRWLPGPAGFWGDGLLLSDDSDLFAVGSFSIGTWFFGYLSGFNAARWDGAAWSVLEPWDDSMHGLALFSGGPAQVSSLVTVGDKLAAGGLIDAAGTGTGWQELREVTLWDGSNWESVPFGPSLGYQYGTPNALFADGDTLYAVGAFHYYPTTIATPVVRWYAGQWSRLDSLLSEGMCLTRYHDQLVMGTFRSSSNAPPDAGLYVWIGNRWELVAPATNLDPYAGVTDLFEYDGLLVAGGPFTSIGGVAANGIAAWNGTSWQTLGGLGPTPSDSRPWITGFASFGRNLIAAGYFAGSSPVPLMEWDGSAWSPVPGITGYPSAVGAVRGRLFVGGTLQLDGSSEDVSVAMWDGHTWTALGSGVNGWVTSFCEFGGDLYVGGTFSSAGGKNSFSVARWTGLAPRVPATPLWLSPGYPNPFLNHSTFKFKTDRGAPVRICVYDLRGREVALIEKSQLPPGTHDFQWDGRDRAGRMVPAGVYFITVTQSDGRTTSRKIVRLR